MELAILTIPLAVIAGYLRGGKLSNLAEIKIFSLWAAFTGFGIRFLVNSPEILKFIGLDALIPYFPIFNTAAYVILFYFCYRNLGLPGMKATSLGALLNFLVIAINGGRMPFQVQEALKTSNYKLLMQTAESGVPVVADNYELPLWFLGDWIRFPGLRHIKLISIGDIIILISIFYLIEEIVARGHFKSKRLEDSSSK